MDRFGPEGKFALSLPKSFESSSTTREIFIKMREDEGERAEGGGKGESICRKGSIEQFPSPLREAQKVRRWRQCWNSAHVLTRTSKKNAK